MVEANEWTKTDHNNDKILAIATSLYKLEKKTSVLEIFQGGVGNRNQTRTNTKNK